MRTMLIGYRLDGGMLFKYVGFVRWRKGMLYSGRSTG